MSFQTDSMIPIGSLQPSSNNFPSGVQQQPQHQQQPESQQQPGPGPAATAIANSYPGLPHAPTAKQAGELGPVPSTQAPLNPALLAQAAPARKDQFGATPFLPPPPASKTSNNRSGSGRYGLPPGPGEPAAAPGSGLGSSGINTADRYAAFESIQQSAFSTSVDNANQGFNPQINAWTFPENVTFVSRCKRRRIGQFVFTPSATTAAATTTTTTTATTSSNGKLKINVID